MAESGKIGRPGLPQIIPVTEFRDIFGVALTNTLSGADPATELKKATEAVQARAREVRAGLTRPDLTGDPGARIDPRSACSPAGPVGRADRDGGPPR